MADQPYSGDEEQSGGEEGSDPEVPPLDVPGDAHANDPQKNQHHTQRAIAAGYEWMTGVSAPFVWRRMIMNSNYWTASATVVIAAATIIYTCYAHKRWSVMNGQLTQMQNQTTLI